MASDQLTELTKAPESSPVLLDSLVGVPRFTMLIFKSLVRVTKATETCDLALEHIGQPWGASYRITLKFLDMLQLLGAPTVGAPESVSPDPDSIQA